MIDSDPAFPFTGLGAEGITKMEYFAAAALTGILSADSTISPADASETAFRIALVMQSIGEGLNREPS